MNIENKDENMTYYLYAGTYTGGMHSDLEVTGSKGIYIYRMDEETNKLHPLGVFGGDEIDPAFLAIKDNLLFAENERKDYQVIRSYRIHEDGSLSLADAVNAKGAKCAHICTDPVGNYVIGAGYLSGSVLVARYESDGRMVPTQQIFHQGHSVMPRRQESAHAHSSRYTPDGKGVLVPDLGTDKVMNYDFDRGSGILSPNSKQPSLDVKPGEGPRHLVFHPSLPVAYLLTEIGNHIYVYDYNSSDRTFQQTQTISVLPKEYHGISYCAELIISGDGRFLYSSNRGHDTISAFTISKETGRLEVLGYFDCGGKGPRHICFGIREEAIVVANKDSNELCVVERNKESGHLGKVCSRQNVPAPACVVLKGWNGQ